MYWPDYGPRKRSTRAWRLSLGLIALVITIWIGGEINGWWQIEFRQSDRSQDGDASFSPLQDETGVTVLEVGQPLVPTRTPFPTLDSATIAPDFALPDLWDEEVAYTLSGYDGQPVILNFWASWCVPCRTEMPALQTVYDDLRDEGLVVLGINQLYVDDLPAAQAFVTDLNLTFPNARDESGTVSEDNYRILGLPTTYFISRERKIEHVQIGQMNDAQIESLSRQLVAGEPLTP